MEVSFVDIIIKNINELTLEERKKLIDFLESSLNDVDQEVLNAFLGIGDVSRKNVSLLIAVKKYRDFNPELGLLDCRKATERILDMKRPGWRAEERDRYSGANILG